MGGQTPATDKNADLGFLWQVQRPVRLGQTAHNPNKLCGENWHMQYYWNFTPRILMETVVFKVLLKLSFYRKPLTRAELLYLQLLLYEEVSHKMLAFNSCEFL